MDYYRVLKALQRPHYPCEWRHSWRDAEQHSAPPELGTKKHIGEPMSYAGLLHENELKYAVQHKKQCYMVRTRTQQRPFFPLCDYIVLCKEHGHLFQYYLSFEGSEQLVQQTENVGKMLRIVKALIHCACFVERHKIGHTTDQTSSWTIWLGIFFHFITSICLYRNSTIRK